MDGQARRENANGDAAVGSFSLSAPSLTLPKGGGAIRGIGEKFAANPATGTASMTIPIFTSPGRGGLAPQLALSYDSGFGNGPFGFGYQLSLPSITRKTDRGLPRYQDATLSDTFLYSGAEDLVPVRNADGSLFELDSAGHRIHRFRPRIDGTFNRIERWTRLADGDVHWRSTSSANITTVYGATPASRIADPADAMRVFGWLICETYDDKGNAVVYEYAPEDSHDIDLRIVNERNRTAIGRSANRYVKRIKYGNRVSRLMQPDLSLAEWMFEVVFDYDEDHELPDDDADDRVLASSVAGRQWSRRPDPFSRYSPGFELRTYRRCHRVLMFHRFEELGDEPRLVRCTEFDYADLDADDDTPIDVEMGHVGSTRFASFIVAVTQSGYILDEQAAPVVRGAATFQTYRRQSLPPVTLEYSKAVIDDRVLEVDPQSVENLPIGLDQATYRWLDLDGEGIPGVLADQGEHWYYKRNLSPQAENEDGEVVASFAPVESLPTVPAIGDGTDARLFIDLAGEGQLDVVELDGPTPGFYERTEAGGWKPFRAFASLPALEWKSPNIRFVDLTGDGFPDVLITDDEVHTWYPSAGESGFQAGEVMRPAIDEESGPRVLFADGEQSVYLADMSGDGQSDLVRVRNGEVCYWPSLGYGRFGAKVTMDNAPWFDAPDHFDQRRLRLADVDGSGVVDILYLARDGARLYMNQSGNRLGASRRLTAFPRIDDVSEVSVLDLLGNGTACLVWSSPLANDAGRPMRYVRLMREKPHLLVRTTNNLGAQTRVQYVPSTKYYLQDKAAGRPWLTRLPFPVHVVAHIESFDEVSRNRFASRFAYHHGYFDGVERDFRGFGMVEQWDTESFEDYVIGTVAAEGGQALEPAFYQPEVMTRTWFHTGACIGEAHDLHPLRHEYYLQQVHLGEAHFPADLDAAEMRECLRALKGLTLRREVYGNDGSAQAAHPYQVTESRHEVQLLQRRGDGPNAVFLTVTPESVSLYYERDPADPRISHGINLEYGPYGNVRKSASIVYGRQVVDAALPQVVTDAQQRHYVTYSEVDYTDDIDRLAPVRAYRLRTAYESRAYEITGPAPAATLYTPEEIANQIAMADDIDYEVVAEAAFVQRRLVAQDRTLFLDDALDPLPLGAWDSLGIAAQRFRLAFTPGVVNAHYAGHVDEADFLAAGYVHFDGDANWWIPSGTALYPPDPEAHFYLPTGTRNAFGLETRSTLDQYDLLIERVQIVQAPWSETIANNDYRVLGPVLLTDPNGNRMAVALDALGQVVRSTVMGKEGANDGDPIDDPTTFAEYDLHAWMNHGTPAFAHVFAREQHGVADTPWRESYAYSNGSGSVAMVKAQAHPGRALRVEDDGTVTVVDADPRWVGNGRTVLNNKGNPVKQYEPYFSTTHEYEGEAELRELGATPLMFYDAVGRNVLTRYPNGTLARSEFDPWTQRTFDGNDTITESDWYADRGSPDPDVEPEPADPERRAAWLSARHAATPGVVHLDSLGRPVYAVSDYGGGKTAAARNERDLTGRFVSMYDPLGRAISSGFVSMAGAPVTTESAEKGRGWIFGDINGVSVKTWDEHGREFRTAFDALRRPVTTFVTAPGEAEFAYTHIVYGDRHPDARVLNLFGTVHLLFDQAGLVRVPSFDFKGNPVRAERVLATDYENRIDWSAVAAVADYADVEPTAAALLDLAEVFATQALVDAFNRPTQVTLPDGSVLRPSYNEAGFLASLQAQIQGQGAFVEFLHSQDYDAKGQRQFAHYGNDLITRYFYDPRTFRLTQLLTAPADAPDPEAVALQNLHYTFDPVGNITQVRDDAQQTHYFNNAVVSPESLFEYDALYQLVRASGREHAGAPNDSIRIHTDTALPALPHANDAGAVRRYTEEYDYDLLGNITALRHSFNTQAGIGAGWTRHYQYAYEDDAADRTNRLSATSQPNDPDAGPYTGTYDHDVFGNITRLPHLAELEWDSMDRLRRVDLGGGGTAHYVYGAGGQRMRKVIDRNGNTQLEWIFLGSVMLFRRRRRDTREVRLERWTVHIGDNAGLIAQVDTKTVDTDAADPANPVGVPVIRYQFANHLGSATIETDEDGNLISCEEYHPFGTSSYRSVRPGVDVSLKRFRFSGKERDDESGLYYFGARYYAPWLGRWISADPAGFVRGFNLYKYCANNPVMFHDPDGRQDVQVIVPRRYTGEESFEDLVSQIPEGYRLRSGVTAENYRNYWENGVWIILEEDTGEEEHRHAPEVTPGVIATIQEGARPHAATVPDQQARARVNEPRNFTPGEPLEGPYNLWSNEPGGGLTDAARAPGFIMEDTEFEEAAEAIARRLGYTGRYDPTISPQHFNEIWHTTSDALATRAGLAQLTVTSNGLEPWRVPAHPNPGGTVQASRELPRFQLAGGLMAQLGKVSGVLTFAAASQVDNPYIRGIGEAAGATEFAAGNAYLLGSASVGSGYFSPAVTSGLQTFGRVGGRVGGGVGMIALSGYAFYTDYQNENYGVLLGDAAGVVGGGAVLAGSGPVAGVAVGVAVTNMTGDWVESKVTPHYGREAGVTSGVIAGAAVGAAIGAAVGVWGFGVAAVPAAAVGAVIGGVAGFIGAYW